ncbi:DNA alkylation repair protein [Yoonia sp. MH D7]
MGKGDSLADQLFNAQTVETLANHFGKAGVFDAPAFTRDVMGDLHTLELKARINHIANHLGTYLPHDFDAADHAIRNSLPPPLDPTLTDNDFGRFIYAPLGVYVENHGLQTHFDQSLNLLETLTQHFSMEYSIRAFLSHNQSATMRHIHRWAVSDNYHVRRLATEGTRPRLPWGQNVGLTTRDTLPILDTLHADPTRFVTRSVANHLNDIAKFDPDAVINQLGSWAKSNRQSAKELDWMTRHALRTLIKSGHSGAMDLLGYATNGSFTAQIKIPSDVALNTKVQIDATLTPKSCGPLMVDYKIDFVKSNGKISSKVFKFKVLQGKTDVEINLRKTHHFDGTATTFKLHKGAHKIHLQVNGQIVASQVFDLG